MGAIIIFIQKAIGQGMCILFGANGEILTEKSGNLNLGVPGMMYMGGIAGLAAAFLYERSVPSPNASVGFVLALLAALAAGALGGLIYSVLTITLRANQNVSGLALTTFGVGVGNSSAVRCPSCPAAWARSPWPPPPARSGSACRCCPKFPWWATSCSATAF